MATFRPDRRDGAWDDPSRLIESWFNGDALGAYAPETIVVAWLAILPPTVDVPAAAQSLCDRLRRRAARLPEARHLRLFDILEHVAAHVRDSTHAGPVPPEDQDPS